MVNRARLISESHVLKERGPAIKFTTKCKGVTLPAFVIRFKGRVHAYVNQCAHLNLPLDWQEGEFFDDSGLYLICATHGATYQPETGVCVAGPCQGKCLTKLCVREQGDKIYVTAESK